jgi:hypothetical protein
MSNIVKVINIMIHSSSSFIINTAMGLESKSNRFRPEGLQAFNTLRRGYKYTHTENGMNHHTHARVRVASHL